MYLLGYIPAHNRVYVADKDMGIFSFSLSLTLVEYQTAILRGDYDTANELLPTIPNDQRNKIARFLEAQGTLMRGLFRIYTQQLTAICLRSQGDGFAGRDGS
jgi:hypothetical protein